MTGEDDILDFFAGHFVDVDLSGNQRRRPLAFSTPPFCRARRRRRTEWSGAQSLKESVLGEGGVILPFLYSLASGSVAPRPCVSLLRFSPGKSRSPLWPDDGGSPEPSFATKLFIDAHA